MPSTLECMAIHMTWSSDWVGLAEATVPDVDAALESLRGSMRRSLRWVSPAWRGCLLKTAVKELTARMDTEARAALACGKAWEGASGPIQVSLSPVPRANA